MIRIRRFGVVRTATVAAVFYALGALIFFAIFAVVFLLAGSSLPQIPGSDVPGFAIGAGGAVGILIAGVVLALVYAVFGWIFTAIACLLYNAVAGFTGGIELKLEAAPAPPATPTWSPPAPAAPPPAATEPPATPSS